VTPSRGARQSAEQERPRRPTSAQEQQLDDLRVKLLGLVELAGDGVVHRLRTHTHTQTHAQIQNIRLSTSAQRRKGAARGGDRAVHCSVGGASLAPPTRLRARLASRVLSERACLLVRRRLLLFHSVAHGGGDGVSARASRTARVSSRGPTRRQLHRPHHHSTRERAQNKWTSCYTLCGLRAPSAQLRDAVALKALALWPSFALMSPDTDVQPRRPARPPVRARACARPQHRGSLAVPPAPLRCHRSQTTHASG
jgi:hypothetical protein